MFIYLFSAIYIQKTNLSQEIHCFINMLVGGILKAIFVIDIFFGKNILKGKNNLKI